MFPPPITPPSSTTSKPQKPSFPSVTPPPSRRPAAAKAPPSPFHWEIEFPDVFFSRQSRLPNPGFHAIIGNPPYDVLSEKENKTDLSALQAYIKSQPRFAPSVRGKNNLYKLFVCQALTYSRPKAELG